MERLEAEQRAIEAVEAAAIAEQEAIEAEARKKEDAAARMAEARNKAAAMKAARLEQKAAREALAAEAGAKADEEAAAKEAAAKERAATAAAARSAAMAAHKAKLIESQAAARAKAQQAAVQPAAQPEIDYLDFDSQPVQAPAAVSKDSMVVLREWCKSTGNGTKDILNKLAAQRANKQVRACKQLVTNAVWSLHWVVVKTVIVQCNCGVSLMTGMIVRSASTRVAWTTPGRQCPLGSTSRTIARRSTATLACM